MKEYGKNMFEFTLTLLCKSIRQVSTAPPPAFGLFLFGPPFWHVVPHSALSPLSQVCTDTLFDIIYMQRPWGKYVGVSSQTCDTVHPCALLTKCTWWSMQTRLPPVVGVILSLFIKRLSNYKNKYFYVILLKKQWQKQRRTSMKIQTWMQ